MCWRGRGASDLFFSAKILFWDGVAAVYLHAVSDVSVALPGQDERMKLLNRTYDTYGINSIPCRMETDSHNDFLEKIL